MDDRTDDQGRDEAVMPWQLVVAAVELEDAESEPQEEPLDSNDFVVPWQLSPCGV